MKEPLITVVKDYEQHLPQNKIRFHLGKHLGIEKKLKPIVFNDQYEFEKEVTRLCVGDSKTENKKQKKFVFLDLTNEHFITTQSKSQRGIQIQIGIMLHALLTSYRESNIDIVLYINNITSNYFIKEANKYCDVEIFINSKGEYIYVKN